MQVFDIPELRDLIFLNSVLTLSDLSRCALVSRKWSMFIKTYLFRTLDQRWWFSPSTLSPLLSTLQQSTTTQKLVYPVTIMDPYRIRFLQQHMHLVRSLTTTSLQILQLFSKRRFMTTNLNFLNIPSPLPSSSSSSPLSSATAIFQNWQNLLFSGSTGLIDSATSLQVLDLCRKLVIKNPNLQMLSIGGIEPELDGTNGGRSSGGLAAATRTSDLVRNQLLERSLPSPPTTTASSSSSSSPTSTTSSTANISFVTNGTQQWPGTTGNSRRRLSQTISSGIRSLWSNTFLTNENGGSNSNTTTTNNNSSSNSSNYNASSGVGNGATNSYGNGHNHPLNDSSLDKLGPWKPTRIQTLEFWHFETSAENYVLGALGGGGGGGGSGSSGSNAENATTVVNGTGIPSTMATSRTVTSTATTPVTTILPAITFLREPFPVELCRHSPNLRKLTLVSIHDSVARDLATVIKNHCKQLAHLYISKCGHVEDLLRAIHVQKTPPPPSPSPMPPQLSSTLTAITTFASLETLIGKGNSTTNFHNLHNNTNHFGLQSFVYTSSLVTFEIFDVLMTLHQQTLTTIDLSFCHGSYIPDIAYILGSCPKLVSLSADDIPIDLRSLLTRAAKDKLPWVCCSTLQVLNLTLRFPFSEVISGPDDDDDDDTRLYKQLATCRQLKTLILFCLQPGPNMTLEGGLIHLEPLRECLEELSFHGCLKKIPGPKEMSWIGKKLPKVKKVSYPKLPLTGIIVRHQQDQAVPVVEAGAAGGGGGE